MSLEGEARSRLLLLANHKNRVVLRNLENLMHLIVDISHVSTSLSLDEASSMKTAKFFSTTFLFG